MWNVTVMHSRRWGRGWVWKSQGRLAWTQSSRRWYGDGDSGDGNRMEMETGTTGMIGDGDHLLSPKALWVWRSYRRKYGVFLFWNAVYWKLIVRTHRQLECGPIPNVMAALSNIGGALCSTPQSLADAHCQDAKAVEICWGAPNSRTEPLVSRR